MRISEYLEGSTERQSRYRRSRFVFKWTPIPVSSLSVRFQVDDMVGSDSYEIINEDILEMVACSLSAVVRVRAGTNGYQICSHLLGCHLHI